MFYKISLMIPKGEITIDADLRGDLDTIRACGEGAAEALERLAAKARNDFLSSKSLRKANQVLAGLREVKATKAFTTFRKNFLIFCGVYAAREVSEKGSVSYIPAECGIEYDKKERAFFERTPFDWTKVQREKPASLAGIKTPVVRKEPQEIPLAELVEYIKTRSDLPEILEALTRQSKGKGKKAETSADALVEATA